MITARLWRIYDDIGSTACATGHYRLAEEMFSAALESCTAVKALRREKIKSLVGLADALLLQNKSEKASLLYKRALNILARLSVRRPADKHILAHILETLAYLDASRNSNESSLKYLLRSVRITQELAGPEHSSLARRLKKIALIYLQTGETELSLTYLQRAQSAQRI